MIQTVKVITEFQGEYRFLSNFYESPIIVTRRLPDGTIVQMSYRTNEHFYQAHKSATFLGHTAIAQAPTPGIAKRMGSSKGHKGFKIQMHPHWDDLKVGVMYIGLRLKYLQNRPLAEKLISTFPMELQEGNRWGDTFWGVDLRTGKGQNMLGKLHISIRHHLMG
jgi:ribA/ribD-fused uncharacterized protein